MYVHIWICLCRSWSSKNERKKRDTLKIEVHVIDLDSGRKRGGLALQVMLSSPLIFRAYRVIRCMMMSTSTARGDEASLVAEDLFWPCTRRNESPRRNREALLVLADRPMACK